MSEILEKYGHEGVEALLDKYGFKRGGDIRRAAQALLTGGWVNKLEMQEALKIPSREAFPKALVRIREMPGFVVHEKADPHTRSAIYRVMLGPDGVDPLTVNRDKPRATFRPVKGDALRVHLTDVKPLGANRFEVTFNVDGAGQMRGNTDTDLDIKSFNETQPELTELTLMAGGTFTACLGTRGRSRDAVRVTGLKLL